MTEEEKISQRYRELGAEEPPRALDDAILAAARNVGRSRQRSYAPLATAAVLALAVAVTLHMQLEQPGIESPAPQAPPPPAVVKDTAPEAAKEIPKIERKAKQPASAAAPGPVSPEPKPFATGKSAASAPARDDQALAAAGTASGELARQADQGSLRKETAEREAPMLQAAPAPPAAKPAPAAPAAAAPRAAARSLREQPVELAPDKELERIAELRRQERHEEADKALAEFRRRHPDYKISGAMLERLERR
jgi:hypothetical protein